MLDRKAPGRGLRRSKAAGVAARPPSRPPPATPPPAELLLIDELNHLVTRAMSAVPAASFARASEASAVVNCGCDRWQSCAVRAAAAASSAPLSAFRPVSVAAAPLHTASCDAPAGSGGTASLASATSTRRLEPGLRLATAPSAAAGAAGVPGNATGGPAGAPFDASICCSWASTSAGQAACVP